METNEQKLAEALILAHQIIEQKNKELKEKDEQIKKLTPSAKYADRVLRSPTLHTTDSVGVCIGVSAIMLNRFLIKKDWLYRIGRDLYPTMKIRNKGYCGYHVIEYSTDAYGNPKTRDHLKWTEEGRKAIIALWNEAHENLF